MDSDSTLLGFATAAAGKGKRECGSSGVNRTDTAARVAAIIARRAGEAGLSNIAYFTEILSGRAPRITRAEAAREPVPPAPPRPGRDPGPARLVIQ